MWTRRAVTAGMAAALASPAWPGTSASKRAFFDSLSFLPDDLREIGAAGLTGMIADVSDLIEVRGADGVPRYSRNFAANDPAIDRAVARLSHSPFAFSGT